MEPSEQHMSGGPPKPRLTMRFGISGHRMLPDGADEWVTKALDELFAETRKTVQQLWSDHRELFCGETPVLRMISPLAEGADRLAAKVALKSGFALDCPLPFARDLYESDFKSETSRATFHHLLAQAANVFELDETRGENDARAYESAGLLTLRQCDILIAVWNGEAAQGRGGTGDVVARAIAANVPVIWIHSEKEGPPKILQRSLSDTRDPSVPAGEAGDGASLAEMLRTMLLPPRDPRRHVRRPPSRRLGDYWREKQVTFTLALAFALLQVVFLIRGLRASDVRIADYLASAREQWRVYWQLLPPISAPSRRKLANVLEPAFAWADGLASYYVRLYRSSYVLSFALSALAVAASLAGLWQGVRHDYLIGAELLLMFTVVLIVSTGAGQSWHDRWIDYRHLAELLRHMRVLTLTGSSTLEIREAAHADDSGHDSGAAWVGWYYRAIVRDIGMAGVCAGPAYNKAVVELVRKTELREQMLYHRAVQESSHKLDRQLDAMGILLFSLAAVVCAMFLADWHLHWGLDAYTKTETFLTAFLPSLGAAIYGIRVQGEFGRVARRARHMQEQLSEIDDAMQKDLAKSSITLSRASFLTERAARAMALDVTDWRFVFREKPLTLPA
jgi:hypothetical protein